MQPHLEPDEHTLELREEELVVEREMREVGQAQIRTRVEEIPARLEVDAYAEEVVVEHVPIGQVVTDRGEPYEDGDVLVVPVYEEQLVVTKRLILREELRIRRVATTRRELFEDTLRRERLDVEDPQGTGLVHEAYADEDAVEGDVVAEYPPSRPRDDDGDGNPIANFVRRALQ
jgi:uncharacterized protein (TIGR02271 family)